MTTIRTGIFTNANGEEFTVKGVPFMLFAEMYQAQIKRWTREGKEIPVIPTYDTEEGAINWDEQSVLADGTPEEKLSWYDYISKQNNFDEEYNTRRAEVCALLVDGEPNDDNDWVDMMQLAGIEIPGDKNSRKLLYFRTKVITARSVEDPKKHDFVRLVLLLQSLSGSIREEDVKAFENSFRPQMENA